MNPETMRKLEVDYIITKENYTDRYQEVMAQGNRKLEDYCSKCVPAVHEDFEFKQNFLICHHREYAEELKTLHNLKIEAELKYFFAMYDDFRSNGWREMEKIWNSVFKLESNKEAFIKNYKELKARGTI